MTSKQVIGFDIETGPLPDDVLLKVCGPFDPSTVKVGNAGAEKAAEKIEDARKNYLADLRKEAALNPLTGRVLAVGVGYGDSNDVDIFHNDDQERRILVDVWAAIRFGLDGAAICIGHNIEKFDLPFLVGRSRLLGVPLPAGLMERKRNWNSCFVDTMQEWVCYQYGAFVGLGKLSRAFDLGDKLEDGAMFHELWFGGAESRRRAEAYLRDDVIKSLALAKRMGVI